MQIPISKKIPPLIETTAFGVLDTYGRQASVPSGGDLALEDVDGLCKFGLGPIAKTVADSARIHVGDQAEKELRSANLTAVVMSSERRKAAINVLEIAQQNGIAIVLLKGIYLSEVVYVEPHHRLMSDVDVLVREEHGLALTELLKAAGFTERSESNYETVADHHHYPPLYHPGTNTAVEIHTRLFSLRGADLDPVLSNKVTWDNLSAFDYRSNPCYTLSTEYQLLYVISHWTLDPRWVTNILSIVDVICILRHFSSDFDWCQFDAWLLANGWSRRSVSVLFVYLLEAKIIEIPDSTQKIVFAEYKRVPWINRSILYWLFRHYPASCKTNVGWSTAVNVRILWRELQSSSFARLRLVFALAKIVRRESGRFATFALRTVGATRPT
ncbi:MAG: nucleotidyltransferase family protein [Pseudomonadota bacterium]